MTHEEIIDTIKDELGDTTDAPDMPVICWEVAEGMFMYDSGDEMVLERRVYVYDNDGDCVDYTDTVLATAAYTEWKSLV